MLNSKNLLYTAAFFVLVTFLGHTAGVILPKPQTTEALITTQELMKQTMVPLPMGSPRSLMELMLGANIFLSIYLLVSSLLFILLAKQNAPDKKILFLNSAGLAVGAVVCVFYFFPIPALGTGLGALFGFIAWRK
jgi:hypothetical protein